jgi:hypothetical protein
MTAPLEQAAALVESLCLYFTRLLKAIPVPTCTYL